MLPLGFEPQMLKNERPQACALDRATTCGIKHRFINCTMRNTNCAAVDLSRNYDIIQQRTY